MGGQAGEADPGQDEIARVIDDAGQVALPGGRVPADETVAGGGFPGGGTEAEQGQQQAVGGVHEVAQLGAGQGLVAERVVALHSFVPCLDLLPLARHLQLQRHETCQRLLQRRLGRGARARLQRLLRAPAGALPGRQR